MSKKIEIFEKLYEKLYKIEIFQKLYEKIDIFKKLYESGIIEIFEKLYDRFGTLADNIKCLIEISNIHDIEKIRDEYESLIEQCPFECISDYNKQKIMIEFSGKSIPQHLL